MSRLSIIAAVARNGVIGRDNTLPWHLPADMAFFKKTTTGYTIVMGRKNYQDIGRPLPNRRNIVLSRDPEFNAPGCEVVKSFEDMIDQTRDDQEVFIIGGAKLYETALDYVRKLYLTKISADVDGDVFFPDINWNNWQEISTEHHEPDDKNKFGFDIVEYGRKRTE